MDITVDSTDLVKMNNELAALRAENERLRTGIETVAAYANRLALGEPEALGVSGVVFMCDKLLAASDREPQEEA